MRNKLFGLSLVLSLIGINFSPLLAQAAGASISLTVNKASISAGNSLVVAVYMSGGGTPINAIEADLTYPASKLQYIGLSYTGSAFSINTPSNGGGSGSVSIQNGTINPVSGGGLVATVTFKALVSSGSATIGISGSSHLINANDNTSVPYSSKGASISFGAASSKSAGSTTSTGSTTPAPPKSNTPPTISAIKVTKLTPFSATITWTTNRPADSAVDYGLDMTYGLSNSSSDRVTSHSVTLSSSFLLPETTFHYDIKSSDADGNLAISADQTLNMPGVAVSVVVLGPDGQPQAGAQVSLDGSTATTDSRGQATLRSGLGNKKITTTYQGVTVQKPITVSKTASPLPPYQLDLTKQPLNPWMLTSVGLIVVVLTLLGIDAVLFGSRVFARLVGAHIMPEQWHLGHQAVAASQKPAAPVPLSPFQAPTTSRPPVAVAQPTSQPAPDPAPTVREASMPTTASDDLAAPTSLDDIAITPLESEAPSQPEPITITHFGVAAAADPVLSTPTKIAVTDAPQPITAAKPAEKKSMIKHPVKKAKSKPKSVGG